MLSMSEKIEKLLMDKYLNDKGAFCVTNKNKGTLLSEIEDLLEDNEEVCRTSIDLSLSSVDSGVLSVAWVNDWGDLLMENFALKVRRSENV